MKYKIGIWGQFGDGGPIADGQAVRTTIITNELRTRYGEDNLYVLNTASWNKQPVSFLFNSIKMFICCKKIVILPADNGFKVISAIYDILSHFFKRELYDVIIGGYLPGLLKNNPKYINRLKKYSALFVQTPNLKKDLEFFGLSNVYILSNLKRLNTKKEDDLNVNTNKKISVCTLSRINETKGIDCAVEAVKSTNKKLGGNYVHLDVYGIVADEYKEHFEELLNSNRDIMCYGGVLKYDKTVETLQQYFALLFPTHYYGEGFPGNVVDAYNSGIPIIATDWLYNKDVIKHNRNGILVPIKDSEAVSDALLVLYNDRSMHYNIAVNNIKDAELYKPDAVLAEFYSFMD